MTSSNWVVLRIKFTKFWRLSTRKGMKDNSSNKYFILITCWGGNILNVPLK